MEELLSPICYKGVYNNDNQISPGFYKMTGYIIKERTMLGATIIFGKENDVLEQISVDNAYFFLRRYYQGQWSEWKQVQTI